MPDQQPLPSTNSFNRPLDVAFALEAAGIGIWELDLVTQRINWDQTCQRLFGLANRQQLAYQDAIAMIHPDDAGRVQSALHWAQNAQSDGQYDVTYRTIGADDGQLRWVRFTGRSCFHPDGQLCRFTGVAQEVTRQMQTQQALQEDDRKRAEQALFQSEARLRNILEQAPLAIGLLQGRDMIIELGNDAFFAVWGKDAAVTGQPLLTALPELADQATIELLRQVYDSGVALSGYLTEARPLRPDRQEAAYFDLTYAPLRDGDGPVTGVMVLAVEVTQQVLSQQREVAQRQEAQRQQLIYEGIAGSTPDLMYVFDRSYRFIYANQALLAMWGRSWEEAIGKGLLENGYEPWHAQLHEREIDQVVATKQPIRGEVSFPHASLGKRVYDYVFAPVFNEAGEVVVIAGTTRDITDIKQAEQAMQASEMNYRRLFEFMQDGYAVCQAIRDERGQLIDYRFRQINPAFSTLTGLDPAQTLGRTAAQVLPGQDSKWFALYQQVLDTRQTIRAEDYIAPLNRWYALTAFWFDDEQFAVLFDDITERKRQEMNLAFLADVSADLVGLTDIDQTIAALGEKIGRHFSLSRCLFVEIDETQQACWVSYGWGQAGAVAIPGIHRIADFIGPAFQGASRAGETVVIEDVFADPRTEGEQYAAFGIGAMVTVPLLRDGEWCLLLGFYDSQPRQWRADELALMRELANRIWTRVERARAEAALRLSEEQYRQLSAHLEEAVRQRTQQLEESVTDLQRSNDNLQQFAYVASHDLQEPLRKIQQFGSLLQGRYADSGGEELTYVERMQAAAQRMSVLIKDLLDYSRITTQRHTGASVSLQTVVTEAISTLELPIEEVGAQIQVSALPVVTGDFTQLGQLFQNLLSNALKFRLPNQQPLIQIQAARLPANQLPSGVRPSRQAPSYHRIQVIDNGIGFDEKYADRIFQVFQRLHGKGRYAGTGIGLAICEKVVANHGGAITAKSQPGQGATFCIYLPA